jgi:hypothetical protein
MRRGTIFWGSVLILIGIALLLDNLGLLGNINVWSLFWPMLLILLGVRILYGTLFRRSAKREQASVPLDGASKGRIKLNHGAGRLEIQAGANPNNLLDGDFDSGVDLTQKHEGDTRYARLQMPSMFFPFWYDPGSLDWRIRISREVQLTLDIDSGASELQMDLSDTLVNELRLKNGASSSRVTLPANAGMTKVFVEAGAASVDFTVPQNVSARVRMRGALTSLNVDTSRFPHNGETYQSADFDSAVNKVDIDIQMGAGSASVR